MKDNKTPAVISPFKKRFLMQFKNMRKLFIVEFILQLLGIPLATLCFAKINMVLNEIQHQENYPENFPFKTLDFYYTIYIFALGFLFLAVITGAVIALKNYSYLLNRNKTDMEMSLHTVELRTRPSQNQGSRQDTSPSREIPVCPLYPLPHYHAIHFRSVSAPWSILVFSLPPPAPRPLSLTRPPAAEM